MACVCYLTLLSIVNWSLGVGHRFVHCKAAEQFVQDHPRATARDGSDCSGTKTVMAWKAAGPTPGSDERQTPSSAGRPSGAVHLDQ